MKMELTSDQREVLLALVDEAIDELGPEIHHTVARNYKRQLRQERTLLMSLRNLLGGTEAQESQPSELVGSP